MKNRILSRVLSGLLAVATAFTVLPIAVGARGLDFTPRHALMQDIIESRLRSLEKSLYKEDDEVIFIVEMTQKPVLEVKSKTASVADFVASGTGASLLKKINTEQTKAIAAITMRKGADMEVLYRYNTVLNGFSVRTQYKEKEYLESLPGVKSVTVAQNHAYVEPVEGYAEMSGLVTSGEMINSDKANDAGYTGKGTVTAILDTGLDVDHSAYDKDPAGARFTLETIQGFVGEGLNAEAAADELYHSAKIPFAYDYSGDKTDVTQGVEHGTHVAGSVGADSDVFKGVAPDTQLVIMKVFGDGADGGASDAWIFAALEDAVKMGVDTINMSLGTASGFTVSSDSMSEEVYGNVKKAGISLMCAAGNDTSSVNGNLTGTDLAPLAHPDTSIVGSPSTFQAAVSVASVQEGFVRTLYFKAGERKIRYTDTAESKDLQWKFLEGEFEFVPVGGYGDQFDFAAVNVQDKIALVQRGELAFTEKEANALAAGAKALIVYDNIEEDQLINMQLDGLLPAIFISLDDGEYMKELYNKTLSVSKDYVDVEASADVGRISEFSSLGVAPDLSLKPEITAPGGNIWSTLPGDTYGSMDGTSMASPHMAGAASILRQYVNTIHPEMSATDKLDLINNLLLSTATPLVDEKGVAYSPRSQGAGLANVWNAITAEAWLSVTGNDRPQAELKDSVDGVYEFEFSVHNFSKAPKTYQLSYIALVPDVETIDGAEYISMLSRPLDADEFTVEFSRDAVTVAPDGAEAVTVTLTLTQTGKDNLEKFTNGIFLDGFICLEDVEGGVDLSLPYLAFYGDWAEVPVFDSTVYDDEPALMYDTELWTLNDELSGFPMGLNLLLDEDDYEADKVVYSPMYGAAGYSVLPVTGLLRAPKVLTYQVREGENVMKLAWAEDVMKSFYYAAGDYITYDLIYPSYGFSLFKGDWDYLTDHEFAFELVAEVDGTDDGTGNRKTQTLSIPFTYDITDPSIVETEFIEKDGVDYVRVTVHDNTYIMGVELTSSQRFNIDGQVGYLAYSEEVYTAEEVKERDQDVVFEIPLDYAQFAAEYTGDDLFRINVIDYAFNEYTSAPLPVSGSNEVDSVHINNKILSVTAGTDMTIGAYVTPATAEEENLTWTTDNEQIASVAENLGYNEDTGLYEAKIHFGPSGGTVHITAESSNKKSDTIEVLVSNSPTQLADDFDGIIHYSGTYILPANYSLHDITVAIDADNEGIDPYVTLIGNPANGVDNPYKIHIKVTRESATLAIRDLNIVTENATPAIAFTAGENKLILENDNFIQVKHNGAGINVPYGVSLAINGGDRDTLKVLLDSGDTTGYGRPAAGAGIGGNAFTTSTPTDGIAGEITINGGQFTFESKAANGACIGGGSQGIASKINLNGGSITMNIVRGTTFSAQSQGAAGIGSGDNSTKTNAFADYTQEINLNGTSITATANGQGAVIGTGYVGSVSNPTYYKTQINVTGGNLSLVGNNTEGTNYGGALIGAGSGFGNVDVAISGGNISAVQNSNAASAIGTGANSHKLGGSVTITGGTITATVPASSYASAIGMGRFSGSDATDTVVTISGGSVKTRKGETDASSVTGTVKNDQAETVYEVKLDADNGADDAWPRALIIDGKDFAISGHHVDDPHSLYPWLTEGVHNVEVHFTDNSTVYLKVTVDPDGTSTVARAYELGAYLRYLTATGNNFELQYEEDNDEHTRLFLGDLVLADQQVVITLVPDDTYILPESIYITVDGYIHYNGDGFTYDPETGTVTFEAFTGDTYINALGAVDKSDLYELLVYAASLKEEDYLDDGAWASFLFELTYAKGIYDDPTATGAQVKGAYELLKTAIERLTKLHDTTALQQAVDKAEALDGKYYTPETWAEVEEMLRHANDILDDPDANQSDINDAAAWLNQALDNLVSAADKTELQAEIDKAEALKEEDYTSDTWAALQDALNEANIVNDNAAAIQPDVDAAKDALTDALEALVKRGDKTDLDKAIADAEALKKDDYTTDTWKALDEALTAAKAVQADADADEATVDAAAKALTDALKALVERGDKTDLDKAIADAEALKKDDYTTDTWKALDEALTVAKAVQADVDADEATVDAAAKALTDALKALVERGDKTDLNKAVADAEALKKDDYTEDTWKALDEALAAAKAVQADAEALQPDVDAAAKALTDALKALVERGDKTDLDKALADAEALKKDDYTEDTWKAFDEALSAAKAVQADADADQAAVDAAVEALAAARKALKAVQGGNAGTADAAIALVAACALLSLAGICVIAEKSKKNRDVGNR